MSHGVETCVSVASFVSSAGFGFGTSHLEAHAERVGDDWANIYSPLSCGFVSCDAIVTDRLG